MTQPRNPAATSSKTSTVKSVRLTQRAINHFRKQIGGKAREAASASGDRKRLALKQECIYSKLADCLSLMLGTSESTGMTRTLMSTQKLSSGMNTGEDFRDDHRKYASLMAQAKANGLADDPFIKEWHEMRSLLGDRETMRRAKRGQETSIKRPLRPYEVDLMEFIAERASEGQSAAKISEAILAAKILPAGKTLSREAIRKRILSLNLT